MWMSLRRVDARRDKMSGYCCEHRDGGWSGLGWKLVMGIDARCDWIELKSGESWGSVWTGLIGAFIIVVCASAVNGKFVKLHPRKMLGYRKKLCQCCQWSHSGQRLQVQQWTESRHLSWAWWFWPDQSVPGQSWYARASHRQPCLFTTPLPQWLPQAQIPKRPPNTHAKMAAMLTHTHHTFSTHINVLMILRYLPQTYPSVSQIV